MFRSRTCRRLLTALLGTAMFVTVSAMSAGAAFADGPGLEQDGGTTDGGGGWSWDAATGVSFIDSQDGWDFTDPGTTDIPSVSSLPPMPTGPIYQPPPNNPSCSMASVPGFLPDDPGLPVGSSYQIWTNGVPDGEYVCINNPGVGLQLIYSDGHGLGEVVPPED